LFNGKTLGRSIPSTKAYYQDATKVICWKNSKEGAIVATSTN
jgi:hypothetical protein